MAKSAAGRTGLGRGTSQEKQRAQESQKEPRRQSPPSSDPLGYVPYDKRLYDALIDVCPSRERVAVPRLVGRRWRDRTADGSWCMRPWTLLVGCSAEGVAEIAGVGPVSVEVVRRLACDANVDLAVEGRDGSILDQGRVRRDPTPVQRVEIDRRDKGCRFPGCRYTEFTNVHHMRALGRRWR